jgi:hypothetical protein
MKNILKEKKEEKDEKEEKEEKISKIEYIFYITLALLLLYEIIKLSQSYFLNPNKIIIQKGGNLLSAVFSVLRTTGKVIGNVVGKVATTVGKVARVPVELGAKITSGVTRGVTGGVSSNGGLRGSNNNGIGYNKNKLSLSNGIKSMSSKISEKESYQSAMEEQPYMRGKVFIFGIILCFFGFLLLSVLPIFSVIFILIIAIAYAKDEFIKFIKSFD